MEIVGQRAEKRVFTALKKLSPPWQFFHTLEWRHLQKEGEQIGEIDVVVFHPQYGVIVLEIKGGEITVQEGKWFYGSGRQMKQSPFSQARRNRYKLIEKLNQRLGKQVIESLTLTHGVWFPDVRWRGECIDLDMPSGEFLLDYHDLENTENALIALFQKATPSPHSWTYSQERALKELLAPDCHLLVPIVNKLDNTIESLYQATNQQIDLLRLFRTQKRLLVEGTAGSGKTLLARTLAIDHAAIGKKVLLTCYNKNLGKYLANSLITVPNITVLPFHDLVKKITLESGMQYTIPEDKKESIIFFQEGAAELLLTVSEINPTRFDTIIVDEATDFSPLWWIALESLGNKNFSWFCFYDRYQSIYQAITEWVPPFEAEPIMIEINVRNSRSIGQLAAKLGQCPSAVKFQVDSDYLPTTQISQDFSGMAVQLRQLLRRLLYEERLSPERIVVLAPYRHTNLQSVWARGLDKVAVSTEMVDITPGKIRIGTIQGFKGLEADVVILAGIDGQAAQHPEWLYVGASRARAALFLFVLEKTGLH